MQRAKWDILMGQLGLAQTFGKERKAGGSSKSRQQGDGKWPAFI